MGNERTCEQCGQPCVLFAWDDRSVVLGHTDDMTAYGTWCHECWELGRWVAHEATSARHPACWPPNLQAAIAARIARQERFDPYFS